jgi:hypothetical protein
MISMIRLTRTQVTISVRISVINIKDLVQHASEKMLLSAPV